MGTTALNDRIDEGDRLVFLQYLAADAGVQIYSFTDANSANVDVAELTLIAILTGVAVDVFTGNNIT